MTYVEHFEEAFSLAYSIRDLFLYLGISFMPPLLEFLLRNYGLSWTFLLLGAIDWHTVISGVLLKQAKPSACQGKKLPAVDTSLKDTDRGAMTKRSQVNSHPCLALFSFLGVSPALHHPIFVLFILLHSIVSFNFVIWALFLVPYGVSLGYQPGVAVFLSTFGGIGGLVGKLIVIIVFYFDKMNQITATVIPCTVYGIALAGYMLFDGHIMLVISSILSGLSLGYADASTSAMLPWYLCEKHLRQGLAMSYFYSGLFMQLGGIIAGVQFWM
ncbi:hypothetical protein HOLleu_26146 [Holothuria leucospilota]|uniref:Uncharacterized protein n=1 Tax=Holothuria leucospilota TaxID=206669 RepID=A0A9Q1BU20_HOLLE|nr:hypothetical protein HOLleu_26146 [Holothuria leucospilota]